MAGLHSSSSAQIGNIRAIKIYIVKDVYNCVPVSPAGLRSGPCAVVPSARASVALPAHVPVPPSRHHRPPADHLSVRRRGASAVPGPLFPSAAGPRATAGAQPRVGPSAA